jgi:hypothetical protein
MLSIDELYIKPPSVSHFWRASWLIYSHPSNTKVATHLFKSTVGLLVEFEKARWFRPMGFFVACRAGSRRGAKPAASSRG